MDSSEEANLAEPAQERAKLAQEIIDSIPKSVDDTPEGVELSAEDARDTQGRVNSGRERTEVTHGKSGSVRKSRRVVRLSRVDSERLAKGDFRSPEDALHQYDAPSVLPQKKVLQQKKSVGQELKALTPREKEILAEVPPHFGKL